MKQVNVELEFNIPDDIYEVLELQAKDSGTLIESLISVIIKREDDIVVKTPIITEMTQNDS